MFTPKPFTAGAEVVWKQVTPTGEVRERRGEVWCLAPVLKDYGLKNTVWAIPEDAPNTPVALGQLFRDFASYERARLGRFAAGARKAEGVTKGTVIEDTDPTSPLGELAERASAHRLAA